MMRDDGIDVKNDTSLMTTTAKTTMIFSSSSLVWPTESANNVLFQVPSEWNCCKNDNSGYCKLQYDSNERYIQIVDACNTSVILDIIDIDDMIGANVEIRMKEQQEEIATTSNNNHASDDDDDDDDNNNNNNSTRQYSRPNSTTSSSIIIHNIDDNDDDDGLRQRYDNNDNNTSVPNSPPITDTTSSCSIRCSNEPSTDLLSNKFAVAIFSIYVYPRKHQVTWFSYILSLFTHYLFCRFVSCNNNNNNQRPQPNYQRCPSNIDNGKKRLNPKLGPRYAHHRKLILQPIEDFQHVNHLIDAIRQLATNQPYHNNATTSNKNITNNDNDNQQQEQQQLNNTTTTTTNKKYLIIVNPKSGAKKNGEIICNTIVQPMLEQAGIDTDVIVTTHPRHASEICSYRIPKHDYDGTTNDSDNDTIDNKSDNNKTCSNNNDEKNATITSSSNTDISQYDALILIGGDGIVHEVVTSIYQRPDYKELLQYKLVLGIIGTGTANGLATSLTYASQEHKGIIQETFLICKGRVVFTDLSHYEILVTSSTSDHNDSSSHTKKNNNHTTNDIITTAKTIETNDECNTSNAGKNSSCISIKSYISCLTYTWGIISDIDIESECIHWLGARRFDVWAVWRVFFWLRKYKGKFSYYNSTNKKLPTTKKSKCGTNNSTLDSPLPSLLEPIPTSSSDWIVIDDEIILFWASHVTHAGKNTYHSPPSKLQDGIFQILLVRGNVNRIRLALIMLGLETGSHVGMPGLEMIECTAFRLEPDYAYNQRMNSINDIDGEPLEDGPVQAYVIPKGYRVFCNPTDE